MALNDVPKSGQTLNATRSPINNNFLGIDAGFSVDHEALTTPTVSGDAGKHKKVTLTQQGSTPTVGATESGVYTKAVSGSPELFIKTGSDSEINITGATKSDNGITILPSGLTLIWGTIDEGSKSINKDYTFTFHTAFSNNNFMTQITTVNDSSGNALVTLRSKSLTGGTLFLKRVTAGLSAINLKYTYFAIGN